MKTPAPADLQRWSDEVARDPRSLAFLPLARAYRRQGLREAALQLCLRGLEAYPEHVEAHGLLALLHLEGDEHQKAADEWSIVLRLEPDNFDALRGMGFYCFERDQLSRARDLLERAAAQRPNDATVQGLLNELGTRDEIRHGMSRRVGTVFTDFRETSTPLVFTMEPPPEQHAAAELAAVAETEAVTAAAPQAPAAEQARAEPAQHEPHGLHDPSVLFDDLLANGPLLGALLVDARGLVLAGRLTDSIQSDDATLGAVVGSAVMEAARTTSHLELGNWRGLLIESKQVLLHVKPVPGGNALVLAARSDAPAGWLVRTSAHAAEQAARFVEEYA